MDNRRIESVTVCEECKKSRLADPKFRCLTCNKIVCQSCFETVHDHRQLSENEAVMRQVNKIARDIRQRELDRASNKQVESHE